MSTEIETKESSPIDCLLAAAKECDVVLVGDWEFPESADRRFFCEHVAKFAAVGFTTLALELHVGVQSLLKSFEEGQFDATLFGERLKPLGYNGWTLYTMDTTGEDIVYVPDKAYFGALDRAQSAGFKFAAVDEEWKYKYRDKHMADAILGLVEAGEKVLFYGGCFHHYRRDKPGVFKTVAELIAEDGRFTSYSVVPTSTDVDQFIEMKDYNSYSDLILRREGRCEQGSCQKVVNDTQIGCRFDKTHSPDLFDVRYSSWDSVIEVAGTQSATTEN